LHYYAYKTLFTGLQKSLLEKGFTQKTLRLFGLQKADQKIPLDKISRHFKCAKVFWVKPFLKGLVVPRISFTIFFS